MFLFLVLSFDSNTLLVVGCFCLPRLLLASSLLWFLSWISLSHFRPGDVFLLTPIPGLISFAISYKGQGKLESYGNSFNMEPNHTKLRKIRDSESLVSHNNISGKIWQFEESRPDSSFLVKHIPRLTGKKTSDHLEKHLSTPSTSCDFYNWKMSHFIKPKRNESGSLFLCHHWLLLFLCISWNDWDIALSLVILPGLIFW